jgi:hypothetical protein
MEWSVCSSAPVTMSQLGVRHMDVRDIWWIGLSNNPFIVIRHGISILSTRCEVIMPADSHLLDAFSSKTSYDFVWFFIRVEDCLASKRKSKFIPYVQVTNWQSLVVLTLMSSALWFMDMLKTDYCSGCWSQRVSHPHLRPRPRQVTVDQNYLLEIWSRVLDWVAFFPRNLLFEDLIGDLLKWRILIIFCFFCIEEKAKNAMLYHYKNTASGFSTKSSRVSPLPYVLLRLNCSSSWSWRIGCEICIWSSSNCTR